MCLGAIAYVPLAIYGASLLPRLQKCKYQDCFHSPCNSFRVSLWHYNKCPFTTQAAFIFISSNKLRSAMPSIPLNHKWFYKSKIFYGQGESSPPPPPCICLQQPNFSNTYGNRLTGQFDQSEITSSSRRPQLPLLSLCDSSIDRGKISASFTLDLFQTSSSRSTSILVVAVLLCFYLCFYLCSYRYLFCYIHKLSFIVLSGTARGTT